MRVIGYIRVSTVDQATEGVSLDAQRARIEGWCAANGGTLAEADVFVDAGLSGKRSDNRPGLQAALDAVCATGGVLVVYSLSRLARSTKDTIAIADRLAGSRAELVSLTERIDTTTATGKMFFRLMAVLAEFERDLISERTKAGLAQKRSESERVGQLPYGYDLADDGRTVRPNPAELALLAEIGALRSAGRSLRWIARDLTRRGVPTKNGGRRWSHTTIATILNRGTDDAVEAADERDPAGPDAGRGQAHPELSVA